MSAINIQASWWVGEAITDRESSVLAVTAGLGSGKTHGLCQWHNYLCKENAECNFSGFMEPSFQKVIDTAIPTYQKVLQSFCYSEGRDYKVVKSPYPKIVYLRLHKRVKHEVHFLSAETPDKIAGVEYSHGSEDEAGINSGEARRNFRGRLYRDPKAKRSQFLLVGAPQGINEFADEFDSDSIEGWERPHPRDHYRLVTVENTIIKKRRFILWTDDNPFVSPAYLAELQETYGHNPNLIRSYRYGQFCPLTEGAAFANYLPQKHDTDGIYNPNPYLPISLTFDFNASPLAWVSIQRVRIDGIPFYVAMNEANEGATNLDDTCVEFAVKHPVREFSETPIYIYGDRTGHAASHKIAGSDFENIKNYLKKLGFKNIEIRAQKGVAPEASSVDALNRLFLANRFIIEKRCRMLRRGLLATVWKTGTRKLDKPAGETHTHHPDAVKYWAYQERDNLLTGQKIYGKN